jgi:predicted aconitase
MKLTSKEKSYLDGDSGEAVKLATGILVKLGESFGAERFIPINSAHILGHYGSLHNAGLDFLEKLAKGGGKCQVPTTVDPSSVDFKRCYRFKVPQEYIEKQKRLKEAVKKLGVIPSWACTPYLSDNVPRFGENIAWAESSAVAYANSIIGARTNRTPFGIDICAAIAGMIPEFGLYLESNRKGSVLFDIQAGDLSDFDFHTLGALIGQKSGSEIPVIRGIPPKVTADCWKCFAAGAASAGSVSLFHVLGVTPEACLKDPFQREKPKSTIVITRKDLEEMRGKISTADSSEQVDLVTLGCPLFSIDELKSIYNKMQGRRVKKGIYFWIYLTQETYNSGKKIGIITSLEKTGIWFSTQTCATISPIKVWGFSNIMTNSAKCALVVPSEHHVKITYRDTDSCLLAATQLINKVVH